MISDKPTSRAVWPALLGFLLVGCTSSGQISLTSAISLALKNDSRIKLAQDDLRHAVAVRQEVKDAYIPTAYANGGAGYTYGITLTVPTIFTLDAQSLIYSPSQRHYNAASRWELKAAELALATARDQVEEDIAVTYLSLDIAAQSRDALASEYQHANALAVILQQRLSAGIDSQLEWKQARRTAAQIHLQVLQQEDEVENLQARMGQMTGLPAQDLSTLSDSIPVLAATPGAELDHAAYNFETVRARYQAEGRRERALGDVRGPWKPIVTFNAQYARVSPINNVTDYYNLRGRYNIFSFGAIVRFPLVDFASRARQREANADASHAMDELAAVQFRQTDERRNLKHSLAELVIRLEVAELEAGIAGDQLAVTRRLSIEGGNGATVMNPKDAEHAAIQERQRYTEFLDATRQLRRTQIIFLRQMGGLDEWVRSVRGTGSEAPATNVSSTTRSRIATHTRP